MGYETTRFIDEVDEEFNCSICSMVLQDPVQTPCDHSFCNECISHWLTLNAIGPVDRQPLATTALKPPSRLVRNLLAKMKIKCDFQQQGCTSIVKLEHLQDHHSNCGYNPDLDQHAVVICDKGCNLKMIRRDYNANNCLAHFAKRLSRQQEVNKSHIQNLKVYFQNALKQKEDKIKKLTGVVNRLEKLIEKGNATTSINDVQANILSSNPFSFPGPGASYSVKCSIPTSLLSPILPSSHASTSNHQQQAKNCPIKWQNVTNMKISQDHPNILKSNEFGAFAQLSSCLDPSNSRFKVEILKEGTYSIGHIGVGLSTSQVPNCEITYYSHGFMAGEDVPTFDVGDIIECGIDFTHDFNNGSNNGEVYFCKNGVLIVKKLVEMPRDEFYPSVWMSGVNNKIKYLMN